MPRPRTNAANRTRRLIVRLTDEDQAAIRANAQKAGFHVSEYVRRVAVNGHIVNVQHSGYIMALASQLRRVGINLNQLTHIANLARELPPELAAVRGKLETIVDRVLRMK